MATRDNLRVGDTDRDAVAAALREHFAQGRLTLDELRERLDAAFAARTFGDLVRITDDLPAEAGGSAALPVPPGTSGWAGQPPGWARPAGPTGGWAGRPGGPWMRSGRPPIPFGLFLLGFWLFVVAGTGHAWVVLAPVLFLVLLGRMRHRAWAQHHRAGRGREVRRW